MSDKGPIYGVELIDSLPLNRGGSGFRQAMPSAAKQLARAEKSIKDNEAMILAKLERFDPEDPPSSQMVVLNQIAFHLEVPRDHTKSYDVAIQMAEWEVGETVELTQGQFQCFVMDDWDWKDEFAHLNKRYTSKM